MHVFSNKGNDCCMCSVDEVRFVNTFHQTGSSIMFILTSKYKAVIGQSCKDVTIRI